MRPDHAIAEASDRRLTPAIWAKWDAKLYNWALCGFAKGIQRAAVEERKVYDDVEHWTFYCDRKPGSGGQADTYEADAPPGINVEGLDTDALVCRLSDQYREAIEAYWAMTGPLEYRASAIGCHVNTLRNRAKAAVVELEVMDSARRPGRRLNTLTGKVEEAPAVVRRTRFVPDRYD